MKWTLWSQSKLSQHKKQSYCLLREKETTHPETRPETRLPRPFQIGAHLTSFTCTYFPTAEQLHRAYDLICKAQVYPQHTLKSHTQEPSPLPKRHYFGFDFVQ